MGGLIYKGFALTSQRRSTIIRALFPNVPDASGPSLRPKFPSVPLFCLLALMPGAVLAALPRPIPDEAPRVKAGFSVPGTVKVGDDVLRLSPGAQIRDTANRVVLPSHVRGEYTVRLLLDRNGQVHRVWILTPEEAVAPMRAPRR